MGVLPITTDMADFSMRLLVYEIELPRIHYIGTVLLISFAQGELEVIN